MSECQTGKILIGPDDKVGPDLGPNRLPPFTSAWLNFFTLTFRALAEITLRQHRGHEHRNVNLLIRKKTIQRSYVCADFPQNMMFLHLCLTI